MAIHDGYLSFSNSTGVVFPLVRKIFHPMPLPASKQDQLPDGWRAEKFKIYNGGHGRVGLHGYAAGRCHRRGTKLVDVGYILLHWLMGWWKGMFRTIQGFSSHELMDFLRFLCLPFGDFCCQVPSLHGSKFQRLELGSRCPPKKNHQLDQFVGADAQQAARTFPMLKFHSCIATNKRWSSLRLDLRSLKASVKNSKGSLKVVLISCIPDLYKSGPAKRTCTLELRTHTHRHTRKNERTATRMF